MWYSCTGRITNTERFKAFVSAQFQKQYADLQLVLQEGTLELFASLLYSRGMISKNVKSLPTFDTVMSQATSLQFKKTPSAIIEHCKKLLSALAEVGGPVNEAALCIGEELTEAIEREFQTTISFQ